MTVKNKKPVEKLAQNQLGRAGELIPSADLALRQLLDGLRFFVRAGSAEGRSCRHPTADTVETLIVRANCDSVNWGNEHFLLEFPDKSARK